MLVLTPTGAMLKAELKDYERAIKDCDKAIEIDPTLAEAYISRGYTKAGLKDYQGAVKDSEKAIEIDKGLHYAGSGLLHQGHC